MYYNVSYELILNVYFVETPMIVGFINLIIVIKVIIIIVFKFKVSTNFNLKAFINNLQYLILIM